MAGAIYLSPSFTTLQFYHDSDAGLAIDCISARSKSWLLMAMLQACSRSITASDWKHSRVARELGGEVGGTTPPLAVLSACGLGLFEEPVGKVWLMPSCGLVKCKVTDLANEL